jgi:hypothetical protein
MELVEKLRKDGTEKGLCRLWQMKLRGDLDTEALVRLYIKGIDFCICEDYPTLDFLRTHFKGKSEPYGVYIDDDMPTLVNKADLVLNGACRGMLEYDGYSVSRLYVRHTSETAINVSGHAVLTIDVFDRAKVHLSVAGDDACVILNVYGSTAQIDFVDGEMPSCVTLNYNNKNTY